MGLDEAKDYYLLQSKVSNLEHSFRTYYELIHEEVRDIRGFCDRVLQAAVQAGVHAAIKDGGRTISIGAAFDAAADAEEESGDEPEQQQR